MLEAEGYGVLEAPLPQEAIRICERHDGPIHLVVTDVVMPQMGGRELVDLLSAARPDMRALFVSGYTDEQVACYGVERGEHAFLHKPYTRAALARKVRDVLNESIAAAPHGTNVIMGGE